MREKHICTNDCHKCLNCGKKTFTPTRPNRKKMFCNNSCHNIFRFGKGFGPVRTPEWITKELMENLYITEGRSVLYIARKIGRNIRTISGYLKRFNIPTRPFSTYGIRDEKHHGWQGGKTIIGKRFRNRREYKEWRKAVFERDNWTCQLCGKRGGNLQADHIKPFALFPELRLEISNGRTLCIPCHRKTDTFGNGSKPKVKNNIKTL